MSCNGNNATPPSPAIAPGAEAIDVPAVAAEVGRRGMDPRVTRLIPAIDAPFFQAGLAGYSDAAMRIVARRHGCPFCVTEALLDRPLLGGGHGFDKADLRILHDNIPGGVEDHPLCGQIMGSEPDEMAAAGVKMIEQARRPAHEYRRLSNVGLDRVPDHVAPIEAEPSTFEAIDINLACPVKKIKAKARGGHWLARPEGAIDILRAVRDALPPEIVTTVKMRRGSDDSDEAERNFRRIFDAAYELGYGWVTVHGRTVEQKYIGPSRWTFLRDLVRSCPDRPIFGSGDVWEAGDIFRMLEFTGVSGVSVARGCIGNPWIFRQARQLMAGEPATTPTIAEQRDVLRQHFDLSVVVNGERAAGRMMRKFGIKFAQHHPNGANVKRRMIEVSTAAEWHQVLDDLYSPERVPAP